MVSPLGTAAAGIGSSIQTKLMRLISLHDHWPAPDALIRTNVLAIQRNELCMAVQTVNNKPRTAVD